MDDSLRLSRAELARLDRLSTEEFGLPSCVLMENAGRGAAEVVLEQGRSTRVVVLAGPGNNGGDGWVVARHLANAGVDVAVIATSALVASRGDAALMRRAVDRMGIPVLEIGEVGVEAGALVTASLIVDGLLGTGFRAPMRPGIAALVREANRARAEHGAFVLALDLPSGLDADTGAATDPTIVADLTVTFAARKFGFDAPGASAFLGRVVVATIGAPGILVRRIVEERARR